MDDCGDDSSSIANTGNQDLGSNSWGRYFSDKLTGLHNQAADHVINNLLLFNENDEIKVVKSLLDTLVEGRFDLWTNCIIKSPSHIHIIIFGLLPRLNEELQIHFVGHVHQHRRAPREERRNLSEVQVASTHNFYVIVKGIVRSDYVTQTKRSLY